MTSGLSFSPRLVVAERSEQQELRSTPYDRWIVPGGATAAEFHRHSDGFLLRFPRQADFIVSADLADIQCLPTPEISDSTISSLFNNAVLPLLGNHLGSLNLHGSAVVVDGAAVAFLGLSRSGKTTLASACARAGHPLLSEDVVELHLAKDGYMVQPKRAVVRLFADSARHLHLLEHPKNDVIGKQEIAVGDTLAIAGQAAPLAALFLLGAGAAADVTIDALAGANAAAQLMPHAFVLDVEDHKRLQAHFERMMRLAGAVHCYRLDYPRRYDHLPAVIAGVEAEIASLDNV